MKVTLKFIYYFVIIYTFFVSCRNMPIIQQVKGNPDNLPNFTCELYVETKDTIWMEMPFEEIKDKYKRKIKNAFSVRYCKCDTVYLWLDYRNYFGAPPKTEILGFCFYKEK